MPIVSNAQTYGDWLNAILEEHKIKAARFAELVQVNRSTVHHWLHNTRLPTAEKVDAIASTLANITNSDHITIAKDILWLCHCTLMRRAQ